MVKKEEIFNLMETIG